MKIYNIPEKIQGGVEDIKKSTSGCSKMCQNCFTTNASRRTEVHNSRTKSIGKETYGALKKVLSGNDMLICAQEILNINL